MDFEQAAKYMIIAWIKDWNLSMYLKTVTGQKEPDYHEAYKTFIWLPTGSVNFRYKYARRYIADNFINLNNLLWDAKTNEDRLKLFKMVMHPIGENHKCKNDAARMEAKKSDRRLNKSRLAENISVETMRKAGRHWNVCK